MPNQAAAALVRGLVLSVCASFASACTVDTRLDGKPCPCAPDFSCIGGRCVEGAIDAGTDADAVVIADGGMQTPEQAVDAWIDVNDELYGPICECRFATFGYENVEQCQYSFGIAEGPRPCLRTILLAEYERLREALACEHAAYREAVGCVERVGCGGTLGACESDAIAGSNDCGFTGALYRSVTDRVAACVAGAGTCPTVDAGSSVGPRVVTGTTVGGASRIDASCGTRTGQPEATITWRAPRAGTFVFDTLGSRFDTVLAVLNGRCAVTELACNEDYAPGAQVASEIVFNLTAGQEITLLVEGSVPFQAGEFVLNITQR